MRAKAPARPLSNLRGLASRWDACFFVVSSGGVAALNRRLMRLHASGMTASVERPDAGGIKALSRWLSVSDTTGIG